MMWTYLWINLGAFIVPFLFSFHPRLRFDRQWHAAVPAILGMMLLFIPWDAWATARGIWGFHAAHLVGYSLLGLPIEEWLFFICIPYACLFTYHCFKVLGVQDHLGLNARVITRVLIAGSAMIAVFYADQLYTCITFGLLAFFLLMVTLWTKAEWAGRAYFAYAVLLLPFLVVNGLLTGTGLEEPVVWYNGSQIWGVRIATIPLEDVFYGLLMFMLSVWLYERRLNKGTSRTKLLMLLPMSMLSFMPASGPGDMDLVRRNFQLAHRDKVVCKGMIRYLEQGPATPLSIAYLGGYQAIWAEHVFSPWSKLETFQRGTANLDRAIAMDGDDAELRFVRLSIQRNCPAFLNYKGHIQEDREFIARHADRIASYTIREMAKALLEG